MLEFFLLLTAGLLGGVVNTVAGGGSFITFPALLAVYFFLATYAVT